ncbi:MAG: tape measure protein, partial [Proteobacteria bacterium]|nr:tape measure protein [Pseudomonadota bacterium]
MPKPGIEIGLEADARQIADAFQKLGKLQDDLFRKINKVADASRRVESIGTRALRAIERTARGALGVMGRLVRSVFSLKTALAAAAAAWIGVRFIKSFIRVGDTVQRMKVALDTLTKGRGTEWFDKINRWAEKMPIDTEKAIQAFIRLKAFGFTPTIKQMTTLVDATIGIGGTAAQLESVSRALGQIAAKGKLSAEELNQLSEAGLPAKQLLAKAFQVTTMELEKMLQKGIKAEVAIKALFWAMDQAYGGASQRMMRQYSGLVDQLKSAWYSFRNEVMAGGGMFGVEGVLSTIVDKIEEMKKTGEWAAAVRAVADAFKWAATKAKDFISYVLDNREEIVAWAKKWGKRIWGGVEALGKAADAVGKLGSKVVTVWNSLPPVIREVGLVAAIIGGAKARAAIAGGAGMWWLMDKAWKGWGRFGDRMLAKYAPTGSKITQGAVGGLNAAGFLGRMKASSDATVLGTGGWSDLLGRGGGTGAVAQVMAQWKKALEGLSMSGMGRPDLSGWQVSGDKKKGKGKGKDWTSFIGGDIADIGNYLGKFKTAMKTMADLRVQAAGSADELVAARRLQMESQLQEKLKAVRALGDQGKITEAESLAERVRAVWERNNSRTFGAGIERWFAKSRDQMTNWAATATNIMDSAAQSMGQAFSTFFFDLFEGRLKSLGDYVKSFVQAFMSAMMNILASRAIRGLLSIFGGGPFGGIGSSMGGSIGGMAK